MDQEEGGAAGGGGDGANQYKVRPLPCLWLPFCCPLPLPLHGN